MKDFYTKFVESCVDTFVRGISEKLITFAFDATVEYINSTIEKGREVKNTRCQTQTPDTDE